MTATAHAAVQASLEHMGPTPSAAAAAEAAAAAAAHQQERASRVAAESDRNRLAAQLVAVQRVLAQNEQELARARTALRERRAGGVDADGVARRVRELEQLVADERRARADEAARWQEMVSDHAATIAAYRLELELSHGKTEALRASMLGELDDIDRAAQRDEARSALAEARREAARLEHTVRRMEADSAGRRARGPAPPVGTPRTGSGTGRPPSRYGLRSSPWTSSSQVAPRWRRAGDEDAFDRSPRSSAVDRGWPPGPEPHDEYARHGGSAVRHPLSF